MTCQLMGVNNELFFREELVYGTIPSGNFAKAPFSTCDIGATDPTDNRVILGYGRQPQRKARNNVPVAGRLVVPLDTVMAGYWFKFFFGTATDTTITGGVSHVWKNGADTIPSFTLCFKQSGGTAPIYYKYPGCLVNTMDITVDSDGQPQLELGIIAREEIEDNVDVTGTPVVVNPVYYHNKMSVVTLNGASLAKMSSASITLNNNIETAYYVGGGGKIGCADPGMFNVSGSMQTRFSDSVVAGLAAAATIVDFAFGWLHPDTIRLINFELDAADILRNGNPISGPGARVRQFNFDGSQDTTEGQAVHVTMVNSQASY